MYNNLFMIAVEGTPYSSPAAGPFLTQHAPKIVNPTTTVHDTPHSRDS